MARKLLVPVRGHVPHDGQYMGIVKNAELG